MFQSNKLDLLDRESIDGDDDGDLNIKILGKGEQWRVQNI